MNPDKNYYATLGVLPSAEDVVIRAAYKALAQRYHPDRQHEGFESQAKMAEINEAYSVLSDPALRSAYDRARVQAKTSQSSSTPPPRPPESKPNPKKKSAPALRTASVWKRFVARCIDLTWQCILVGFGIGFVASFNTELSALVQQANPLALGMIVLPVALLLDVAIQDAFPNAPGKALLGVQVLDKNGKPLTSEGHFSRNMGLWLQGLALGLPFLSAASSIFQAIKVKSGGYATYDRARQVNVQCKPIGVGRLVFAHALFFVLLVVSGVFKETLIN